MSLILIDPRSPKAQKTFEALNALVPLNNLPITLVFGGDGFMLESIRHQKAKGVFLGINTGTLGFLMNDPEDLALIAQQIHTQQWHSYTFPRLYFEAQKSDRSHCSGFVVNDLYMARSSGQSANLKLDINGVNVVEKLMCDGLIISTALGSTAYSSSAGGSPCHPLIRGIHITPISPRSPRLRPFMVPQNSVIELQALHHDRRPAQVVSDGRSQGEAYSVRIATGDVVQIAFLSGHNFTETLIRKSLLS